LYTGEYEHGGKTRCENSYKKGRPSISRVSCIAVAETTRRGAEIKGRSSKGRKAAAGKRQARRHPASENTKDSSSFLRGGKNGEQLEGMYRLINLGKLTRLTSEIGLK